MNLKILDQFCTCMERERKSKIITDYETLNNIMYKMSSMKTGINLSMIYEFSKCQNLEFNGNSCCFFFISK